jgi:ABC-type branched-subunit amino acid transport system substrate-binding protein
MKKALLSVVLVVLMVGIAVAGCAKPAPSPTPAPAPAPEAKTMDIGVATPLTGPAAHLGTNMQNAALIAIDDQNKQGGVTIAGQKYTLNPVVRDTKGDLLVGKSIAEEMVFNKGIKVIAGPFLGDSVGIQAVTEPNKIILFAVTPMVPSMTGPNKPYTFFYSGPIPQMFNNGSSYIAKYYPDAKTVMSMAPDGAQLPQFLDACQTMCKIYGFQWLGVEKFPYETKDFGPYITRVLAKSPDIIDTSFTAGDFGALAALMVKQIREAGFEGIIWMPTPPPPGSVEEVVPLRYQDDVVTNDVNAESPMVSDAYRDLYNRYLQKFGSPPVDIVAQLYNVIKPLFEFLNTQNTMDTTAWMEGFANYSWQGIYGKEAHWIGLPMYGIDRMSYRADWASIYKDGKMETVWEAPIPEGIFAGR